MIETLLGLVRSLLQNLGKAVVGDDCAKFKGGCLAVGITSGGASAQMGTTGRIREIIARWLNARTPAKNSVTLGFFRPLGFFRHRPVAPFAVCGFLLLCQGALAYPHHPSVRPALWLQRGHGHLGPEHPGPEHFGHPYAGGPPSRGEHLPQWYRQHQNLSPQEQERALRAQPGFNRLPDWEQQRLFQRLRELNAMPPLQRERTLQRMEAFERLSPEQRQQVRATMQEVTQMPMERRRRMRDAFQTLSQTPPAQREALLHSPEYERRFSPHELEMLSVLMGVEPYTPPTPYGSGTYGGPPR